jgi:hypothetical protein
MTKPKDMCWECWYVWKDIISSALNKREVYFGNYTEDDMKFLHCHHKQESHEKTKKNAKEQSKKFIATVVPAVKGKGQRT